MKVRPSRKYANESEFFVVTVGTVKLKLVSSVALCRILEKVVIPYPRKVG